MVPNPQHQEIKPVGRRQLRDTLQRYSNKKSSTNSASDGPLSRPNSRFSSSVSVEELNLLTRKINLQTARTSGEKAPLFRSHSAPIETETVRIQPVSVVHKAYRSYSDTSSNSSSSSKSSKASFTGSGNSVPGSGPPELPPSRYHLSKQFKRRVTFNEAVQVFELPEALPNQSDNLTIEQKPIVPYTKTRMKIKKDKVKFEEIKKNVKRPTSRIQSRMTSYVRDKLKAN